MNPDKLAKSLGFLMNGHSSNGHAKYIWFSPDGIQHLVVGPGRHTKVHQNDLNRIRQRINRCKSAKCEHSRLGGS